MIDAVRIREIAEAQMDGTDLFVVDVRVAPGNGIEVVVDSDTQVGIDRCVALSRAIEASLDREQEDFELTVTSAGIGQPLRMLRQYRKLIGREVEVVLKEGGKLVATLTDATGEAITVEYQEKAAVEGKSVRSSLPAGASCRSPRSNRPANILALSENIQIQNKLQLWTTSI